MDTSHYPSHACEHEQQELRRVTRSNGVQHYVLQCLECGSERKSVARNSPDVRALTTPPPDFDHTIARVYWQSRTAESRERTRAKREQEAAERAAAYDAYINSDLWRRKRAARLALDGRVCQAKMDGCLGSATDVHHWTYQHFGNEPLFELVSVCRPCHDQITEMDRRPATEETDERLAS